MKQVEVILEYCESVDPNAESPKEWWVKMVLPFETPVRKLRITWLMDNIASENEKLDIIGATAYLQVVAPALAELDMELAGIGSGCLAYKVLKTKDPVWVCSKENEQ